MEVDNDPLCTVGEQFLDFRRHFLPRPVDSHVLLDLKWASALDGVHLALPESPTLFNRLLWIVVDVAADNEGKADGFRVSPFGFGVFRQLLNRLPGFQSSHLAFNVLHAHMAYLQVPLPAISDAGGPFQCRIRGASDPDRRVRFLYGLGLDDHVPELVVLALVGYGRLRPDPLQNVQNFVRAARPLLEGNSNILALLGPPAQTRSEDKPSIRKIIDGADAARQLDR